MIVEDLFGNIQQFKNGRIADRVINVGSFLAGNNDVFISQNRKLLRGIGRLDFEALTDLIDSKLMLAQGIQNGNAQRVR